MSVPNQAMREAWDGPEGAHWTAHAPQYAEGAQRITPHLFAGAAIAPSDRVLDIGCGFGDTTIEAGRRASAGAALGVDLSSEMLNLARKRAADEGLAHVTFEQADAQVDRLGASHTVAISRFGVMFFDDPVAAFANIRGALAPGGRLALLTWATLRENPWVLGVRDALAEHIELPEPPPGPMPGPGPFSLAAPDQIRGVLTDAGYTDVSTTQVDEDMFYGPNADAAYGFVSNVGFVRGALAASPDDATSERALAALRQHVENHAGPGGVWIPSRAWLVTALNA